MWRMVGSVLDSDLLAFLWAPTELSSRVVDASRPELPFALVWKNSHGTVLLLACERYQPLTNSSEL